ncbi:hypothetical protein [Roseovarius sp. MBR-6]|jgi:hypothetical protein|uniref:hypothetical protein n=1 Tax=Roseovarius sp. MBR-6 TaxID=3156459 RepID=UPI003393068F
MATPAQIANDMAAHAACWAKRDRNIGHLCRDLARVIRAYLAGEAVDGRTYYGIQRRCLAYEGQEKDFLVKGYPDIIRARCVMERLRAEAGV